MENLNRNLAENIKKLRKEKGMTQTDLAVELGVSKHSIISYEKEGTFPTSDIIGKLVEFFSISPNELFLYSVNNDQKSTDKERKVEELKEFKSIVLDKVIDLRYSGEEKQFGEEQYIEGEIDRVEFKTITPEEQAKTYLIQSMNLNSLSFDLLEEFFEKSINEQIAKVIDDKWKY